MATESREPLKVMSFGEHLEELRSRLFRCVLATAVGFIVALCFQNSLVLFLATPHQQAMEILSMNVEVARLAQSLDGVSARVSAIAPATGQELARRSEEYALVAAALAAEAVAGDPNFERWTAVRAGFELLAGAERSLGLYPRFVEAVEQLSAELERLEARHTFSVPARAQVAKDRVQQIRDVLARWNSISRAPDADDAHNRLVAVDPNGAREVAALTAELVLVREKIRRVADPNSGEYRLKALGYPDVFFAHIKVCVLFGLLIGLPWTSFELWAFIAAGLYPRERHAVSPLIPLSLVSMVAGAAFAFYVVIPVGLAYLGTFGSPELVEASYTLKEYLSLVIVLMLGMGLVFQLPLGMVFVTRAGLIPTKMFRKYRRYSIIGAVVIGAILTPPDAVSQLLMVGPMLLLYELGIVACDVLDRRAARREAHGASSANS
ncbi:MAG: twin-arginine translocase subunit TatC [Planctomycetota bacterium]